MNENWERLNTWHLQLSIAVEAVEHVLREVEDPPGLSAIADVLKNRLHDLVESCPFPERHPAAGGSQHD